MELTLRLGILKEGGQLSEDNYDKIIEVIKYFDKEKGIKLLEENAAMFITHLYLALKRIEENNIIEEMEKQVKIALELGHKYNEAVKVTQELEKILGDMPKAEFDFLVMHICSLI